MFIGLTIVLANSDDIFIYGSPEFGLYLPYILHVLVRYYDG
jgi:hypothetical protein